MLFICTTKTIVRIPVFWNKFGTPVSIIVMGILMQNHNCDTAVTLSIYVYISVCDCCIRHRISCDIILTVCTSIHTGFREYTLKLLAGAMVARFKLYVN